MSCVTSVHVCVFCLWLMHRVVCWQWRWVGTMAPTSSTNRLQTNRSGFLLPPGKTGESCHTWPHTPSNEPTFAHMLFSTECDTHTSHHGRLVLRHLPHCSCRLKRLHNNNICLQLSVFLLCTAAALFCWCYTQSCWGCRRALQSRATSALCPYRWTF